MAEESRHSKRPSRLMLLALIVLAPALFGSCAFRPAESKTISKGPKPHPSETPISDAPNWMTLTVEGLPASIDTSETRRFHLLISLSNRSRKARTLRFPTSQRFDLALFTPDGERLFLWSEDNLLEETPELILLNPGDKLLYHFDVPTRGMKPDVSHRLEITLAAEAPASKWTYAVPTFRGK